MFGRKGVNSGDAGRGFDREQLPPGHRHVLDHLDRTEAENPDLRAQMGGMVVFEQACRIVKIEGRIRVEDLIAMLASPGGYFCIEAAMSRLRAMAQTPQAAGMLEVAGNDGHRYYFGDLPNSYLWESPRALLSLTLGAAQANGGAVSAQMVTDCMARTARSVGGPDFGVPELAENNLPPDLPINFVIHFAPKFREALDLFEVPCEQRPAAMGFALQRAIDACKDVVDPGLMALVAVECAVPMAKLDPARFERRAA